MKRPSYFCIECKDQTEKIEEMFIVEEHHRNLFCSKDCILKFYHPYIDHYQKIDLNLRSKHKVLEDEMQKLIENESFAASIPKNKHEIYLQIDNYAPPIYCLIVPTVFHQQNYYVISLCLVYQGRPSLLLHQFVTQNEKLKNFYTEGVKVQSLKEGPPKETLEDLEKTTTSHDENTEIQMDEEELQKLENKKSEFLAELMNARSPSDITFEDFDRYMNNISPCLSDPDEIFEFEDHDGDAILVYIKAFAENDSSYYYIVLGIDSGQKDAEGQDLVIPILSFPTVDPELYRSYRRGGPISVITKS